jgi:nitrogen regulatory protein PII
MMNQLTIIVKPFRAEAVLRAIAALGISACVVREAKGYSRQKGYLERYVGSEYSLAFLPKVEISLWVEQERSHDVEEAILSVARTGRIGDGKIFVVPTAWPHVLEF